MISRKSNLFFISLVIGVAVFLFVSREITPPFILAFVIAYLSRPLALFLQKKRLGRVLPALLVTVIFISLVCAFFAFLVPFLSKKIIEFFQGVDLIALERHIHKSFVDFMRNHFPGIKESYIISVDSFLTLIDNRLSEGMQKFAVKLFGSVFHSVDDALIMLLAPVILYHMVKDWEKMQSGFYSVIPKRLRQPFTAVSEDINAGLRNYLVAQARLSLSLSLLYAFLLYFTKLEYGILMGLLIGLFSFVPYIGFLIMSVVTLSLALNNLQSDFVAIRNVIFALGFGQMIDIAIINPRIMGNTLNLSPVWILFGVLSCSVIFGALGMFFALPIIVVVTILFRRLIDEYKSTRFFSI